LGFSGTDVGDGWLIFDAPEADLAFFNVPGGFKVQLYQPKYQT
jgi:hypothetical protein